MGREAPLPSEVLMADSDFDVAPNNEAEESLRPSGETGADGPAGRGPAGRSPAENGSADGVNAPSEEAPSEEASGEEPVDEETADGDPPNEESPDEEPADGEPPNKEPKKRQEYVFVPFGALYDTDTLFGKQSVESMRAEYQIIQRLKKMSEMERAEESVMTESEMRESNLLHVTPEDSVEDIERKLIQRRCEEMRPDAAWKEIAESLGMSKKTLYQKRKRYDIFTELFD